MRANTPGPPGAAYPPTANAQPCAVKAARCMWGGEGGAGGGGSLAKSLAATLHARLLTVCARSGLVRAQSAKLVLQLRSENNKLKENNAVLALKAKEPKVCTTATTTTKTVTTTTATTTFTTTTTSTTTTITTTTTTTTTTTNKPNTPQNPGLSCLAIQKAFGGVFWQVLGMNPAPVTSAHARACARAWGSATNVCVYARLCDA